MWAELHFSVWSESFWYFLFTFFVLISAKLCICSRSFALNPPLERVGIKVQLTLVAFNVCMRVCMYALLV